MPKLIELLPCDWLISYLCYQAIEQVYLKVAGECIVVVVCLLNRTESMKAVTFSIYSAIEISWIFSVGHFKLCESTLWPSDGDLLLITEPCFTDKMRMTIV